MVVPVRPDTTRWQGAERIRRYLSLDWAERGCCEQCGSALFDRLTARPMRGNTLLALGLFDEPDRPPLATEIFVDANTSAFALAGEHPRLAQAEFEASLGLSGP